MPHTRTAEIPEGAYQRMAQLAETSDAPPLITEEGKARYAVIDIDAYDDLIALQNAWEGVNDNANGRFAPLSEGKRELDELFRV